MRVWSSAGPTARQRIYSLAPLRLREVNDWTAPYRQFWQGRLKRLRSYLDEEQ